MKPTISRLKLDVVSRAKYFLDRQYNYHVTQEIVNEFLCGYVNNKAGILTHESHAILYLKSKDEIVRQICRAIIKRKIKVPQKIKVQKYVDLY